MEYTRMYSKLKSAFDPDVPVSVIEGSGTSVRNCSFTSEISSEGFFNKSDLSINENITFSYPVFVPSGQGSGKVIILLHGLNERSWIKYLVWAYYLSEQTDSHVVLFPISFHINRSPSGWKDPRVLYQTMNERKITRPGISALSFANIALSNRLTDDPRRFFNSGYQTVNDIVKLIRQIKGGVHEAIPAGSRINIFAYSIGAFLAQIIMMGNPESLFTESRLFMFCGGSVFSKMYGTSRLIMDSLAYKRVYSYYLDDFEKGIKGKSRLTDFLQTDNTGMAFRSMIDIGRHREFREKALVRIYEQTRSVALAGDTVIPPGGIVDTLNFRRGPSGHPVEIADFDYPCSHENPFPLLEGEAAKKVDTSFERIFSKACSFLG